MNNEIVNESELLEEKGKKEEKRDFRDSLYGRIDVSLESVDKFIIGVLALLGISIVLGVVF